MSKSVFCLCDTAGQAESIVDGLRATGFSNNDISVLFPDKSGTRDFAHEQHTKAPEGAAAGAGTGGVLGEYSVGSWASARWLSPASDHLSPPDRSWPRWREPVSAPPLAGFRV